MTEWTQNKENVEDKKKIIIINEEKIQTKKEQTKDTHKERAKIRTQHREMFIK